MCYCMQIRYRHLIEGVMAELRIIPVIVSTGHFYSHGPCFLSSLNMCRFYIVNSSSMHYTCKLIEMQSFRISIELLLIQVILCHEL